MDSCNNETSGIFLYANFTDDKKGAPDNESRGILISITEPSWPQANSIAYQLFISYLGTLYIRTWVSGVNYGQWLEK